LDNHQRDRSKTCLSLRSTWIDVLQKHKLTDENKCENRGTDSDTAMQSGTIFSYNLITTDMNESAISRNNINVSSMEIPSTSTAINTQSEEFNGMPLQKLRIREEHSATPCIEEVPVVNQSLYDDNDIHSESHNDTSADMDPLNEGVKLLGNYTLNNGKNGNMKPKGAVLHRSCSLCMCRNVYKRPTSYINCF